MRLPGRRQRDLREPLVPPQAGPADLCHAHRVTATSKRNQSVTAPALAAQILSKLGLLERGQEWLFCSEEGYPVSYAALELARAMLKAGV